MGQGIRAEVAVDPEGRCPVVDASDSVGAPTYSVTRSVDPDAPERVTEEFVLETGGRTPETDVDLTEVFDYGGKRVYRFERELGSGCPREFVERFDCPVADVHARDGMLYLVFHATGMEQLQAIIGSLRSEFSTVDVQRLLRTEHDRPDDNLVLVDRGALTERQREVLETAHRMGYFERPKGANASEVADALDISPSTFAEHLAAAQTKLLDVILES